MSLERKYSALTPSQMQAVAASLDNGVRTTELADAYGVSVRTIQRTRNRSRAPWTSVSVAGWSAEYIVTDLGPIRMTPWYPVVDNALGERIGTPDDQGVSSRSQGVPL